jgi:ribosomal protein S18 acetylase RimI-like enzyme
MADDRHVRLVPFDSVEYRETVKLRDDVLRAPLGLALSPEELGVESGDLHLACYVRGQLAGCLVLTPRGEGALKMRQVAVIPTFQNQGIGKLLVSRSERIATERGYKEMVLHARKNAVPFYTKLGYEVIGESFNEVTIPHRAMRKNLAFSR